VSLFRILMELKLELELHHHFLEIGAG